MIHYDITFVAPVCLCLKQQGKESDELLLEYKSSWRQWVDSGHERVNKEFVCGNHFIIWRMFQRTDYKLVIF